MPWPIASTLMVLALAGGPTALPAGPQRYTVVDLGRISNGSPYPHAISNDGRVVLSERDTSGVDRSFVWDRGERTVLPPLPGTSRCIARAISDTGVIGGSCGPFTDLSGTVWTDDGPRFIGTLGGTLSDVMHLSPNGNYAGYSRPFADQGLWHGFAVIDGVMHDLGPMPFYDGSSAAVINDSGRVADALRNHKTQVVPCIWDVEHGFRELPTLGGPDAAVNDINNRGQLAGYASDGRRDPIDQQEFVWLPVRWEPDGRITRLGTRPDRPAGTAIGINEQGDTVGVLGSLYSDTARAVLWSGPSVIVLQEVITPGSGWTLNVATDINDAGQIVGVGTLGGTRRAFLLQPE